MANPTDQRKTSVTFGLTYPTIDQIVEKNPNSEQILNKNLIFTRVWGHIEKTKFNICRVKYDESKLKSKALLSKTIFKDCIFEQSFLGSTLFQNVTFTNCRFEKCDFYASTFDNCNFTGCEFKECSAWLTSFNKTVISSTDFLNGIIFTKNYDETSNFERFQFRYHKTRLDIACNLMKSAADTYDTNNINNSIYAHKLELVKYYQAKIRYNRKHSKTDKKMLFRYFSDCCSILFLSIINFMSNGGTSLKKLLFAFLVIAFAIGPFALKFSTIQTKIAEKPVFIADEGYFFRLATSFEAFLGFGYTNLIQYSKTDKLVLILLPITGLFIFAMLLHTIIKKVFR